MKPFSPLYFIKQNKLRCILLMFMIFLSFGAYLGGLYIYTPQENWEYSHNIDENHIEFYSPNNKEKRADFKAFCEEIKKRDDITILELGFPNELTRKTVMGFTDGTLTYTFRTVEDFKLFCNYHNIDCDFSKIESKTVVMSRYMADNGGYKTGDIILPDEKNYLFHDFKVAALTEENGYTQYFIGTEEDVDYTAIIFGNGISLEETRRQVNEIAKTYPISYRIPIRVETEEMYSIFNTIFFVVVIFLAIILSVTVNAAFVGMYQRREFEFAVYRAIGISKKKIIRKIAGEILFMDVIVLIVGGGIFFLALYLFNELVLASSGVYLVYTAPIAVIALVLCNLMTVIPLILTRSRVLLKADICNY